MLVQGSKEEMIPTNEQPTIRYYVRNHLRFSLR
jgi:hypothetical protein